MRSTDNLIGPLLIAMLWSSPWILIGGYLLYVPIAWLYWLAQDSPTDVPGLTGSCLAPAFGVSLWLILLYKLVGLLFKPGRQ